MDVTTGEVLFGLAAIGLVVFLMWFPWIMGTFVTLYERLGKRLEDHQGKRGPKNKTGD